MIQFNNGGCICLIRRSCPKKRGNMRNVDVKYNSRDSTEGSSVRPHILFVTTILNSVITKTSV